MLISKDSPFRKLPEALDKRQLFYFEGIRYAVNMVSIAYTRLQESLYEMSHNENYEKEFSSILLDAWSILDSVSRFNKLVENFPVENSQTCLKKLKEVTAFRNTFQHLHERIDERMIDNNYPVWGILSWLTVRKIGDANVFSCMAISGSIRKSSPQVLNPAGRAMKTTVSSITLESLKNRKKKPIIRICISEIVDELEKAVRELEEQMRKQFKDLPHHGADLLLKLEFAPSTK